MGKNTANIEDISDAFYKKYETANNILNEDKMKKAQFTSDFSQEYNNAVFEITTKYSPLLHDDIKRNILGNLQSQIEKENQSIIDLSTGTIRIGEIGKFANKVEKFLISKHPEKYVPINLEKTSDLSTNENSQIKEDAFNKLFDEYNKFETKEEKINFIKENICYNWDELSEEQQQIVFDATETYNDFIQFEKNYKDTHKNADKDEIRNAYLKEHTDSKPQDLDNLLQFIDDYKDLTSLQKEYNDTKDPKLKPQIEELQRRVDTYMKEHAISKEEANTIIEEDLKSQNIEPTNESLFKTFNEGSKELSFDDLDANIPEAESLDDILSGNISEDLLTQEVSQEQANDPLQEDSLDLDDLFGDIDIEPEDTSLDNILNADLEKEQNKTSETIEEDDKLEPAQSSENTYTNPIMAGVKLSSEELESNQEYNIEVKENPISRFLKNIRNRFTQKALETGQVSRNQNDVMKQNSALKQEDYTHNIEEKQGIFSRIRNALSTFVNRYHKEETKAIDTAENNTNQETNWGALPKTERIDLQKKANKDAQEIQHNQNKLKHQTVIETDNTLQIE